eukprot:scaffold73459_cov21-Tisochrysis_lutea.AAC.1
MVPSYAPLPPLDSASAACTLAHAHLARTRLHSHRTVTSAWQASGCGQGPKWHGAKQKWGQWGRARWQGRWHESRSSWSPGVGTGLPVAAAAAAKGAVRSICDV